MRLVTVFCVFLWAWPADAAISRPQTCTTATSNSVSLPTHAVGDILIVWTWRDTDTTAITIPGTFTTILDSSGTSRTLTIGYLIADTTTEVSDTWTNAEAIIACVFRGVDNADPVGGVATNNAASGTTINYPAVTFEVGDSSSWLLSAGGSRTNTTADFGEAPGAQMQIGVDDGGGGAGGVGVHSSEGGLASWSSADVTVSISAGWRTYLFELRAGASSSTACKNILLLGVGGACS